MRKIIIHSVDFKVTTAIHYHLAKYPIKLNRTKRTTVITVSGIPAQTLYSPVTERETVIDGQEAFLTDFERMAKSLGLSWTYIEAC